MLRRRVGQCSSLAQRRSPVQKRKPPSSALALGLSAESDIDQPDLLKFKKAPSNFQYSCSELWWSYLCQRSPCTTHVLMHNSSSSPLFVKNSLHIFPPGGSGKNKVLACLAARFYTMEIGLAFDAKWVLRRKRSFVFTWF